MAYLDVSQLPLKAMPGAFFHFSATEPAFAWFWWGSLAFALVYVRMASAPKVIRRGVLAGWLLVGVAYYCTLRPGREAVHYLQLLVLPLGLLGGFSLAGACHLSAGVGPTSWLRRAQPWMLFFVLTLSPQVYNRAVSWNRFVGYVSDYRSTPASPAARYILDHMQPGDTLAMWGWEPALYVETGLPQGTREAHTANQLMAWPLQPFFLTRYLRDLDRRRPAWFVDAVGPGAFIYELRHACGYETVPELARVIDTRYELVAEFRNLRIFHLKLSLAD